MYLLETHEGNAAVRKFLAEWAKDAPEEVLEKGEKVEVHSSSFSDPGPDFNIYKVFDGANEEIYSVRKEGY